MSDSTWELRDVELGPSGKPLDQIIARLPCNATNPEEALNDAWNRMTCHVQDGSLVECVAVADGRGKIVAFVTKMDVINHALN